MSESNRIKASSVAAFLFMPQFKYSFEGFSHIVPVFMRTLALILSQAALIPHNHPATRYGAQGVEKYSFRRLMGEAWFTLRTTRASRYQWGVFAALVMMICTVGSAAGVFILNIAFGFGTKAMAQTFIHPGDPYGAGVGKTSLDAIIDQSGSASLFDKRAGAGQASQDYALMVLDKVLREGAVSKGGALQNSLGALMQVYNTGVLTVAAVMIFWMIMSIVVDTAKTGVVGGGRHNMVWAPIRVVFALGLMIPLGSVGFSSGQFMVMKLAEWGSNLGTNAWYTYVTKVSTSQNILAPYRAENVSGLVTGINKIMTCQVAYNAAEISGNSAASTQMIVATEDTSLVTGTVTRTYGNSSKPVGCGKITYDLASAGDVVDAWLKNAAAANFAVSYATPVTAAIAGFTDPLSGVAADFRMKMKGALNQELRDNGTEGSLIKSGRDFACSFVGNQMAANDGQNGQNIAGNPAAQTPQCGADRLNKCGAAYPGTPPGDTCAKDMTNTIIDKLTNTFSQADDGLINYISNVMPEKMKQRGWGGMALWTQEIVVLNGLISNAREVTATVDPGSLWDVECDSSVGKDKCNPSETEKKTLEILDAYDRWWEGVTEAAQTSNTVNGARSEQNRVLSKPVKSTAKSMIKKAKSSTTGSKELASRVMSLVMPQNDGYFLFDSVELSETDTYPLAELAYTGHQLMYTGMSIWTITALLQTVSTIEMFTFSAGAGFALSALMNGAGAIGTTLIICGMVLAFYLPALPFIKTALAVLTWIISVFEAVCMVPIAALAHLTSEGEGLAGGARQAWILWLNVLLRPVLVVLGFVGAMLVFNTFAVFWHIMFSEGAASLASAQSPIMSVFAKVAYTIIYLSVLYTAANTTFKMLDLVPNALMRWMGGSPDHSFDDNSSEGMMIAGSQMLNRVQPQMGWKAGIPEQQAKQQLKVQDAMEKLRPGSSGGKPGGGTPGGATPT